MNRKLGTTGYFALFVVALSVTYFAIPEGSVQTFSFTRPVVAQQTSENHDVSEVSSASLPLVQPSIAPAEIDDSPASPTAPDNLGKSIRMPVLMYHHVAHLSEQQRAKDPLANDLTVDPADFEAQVKYFYDLGYHSITVNQLYLALTANEQLPSKPLIFTFDDGYMDDFTNAEPILKKYGYSGSFAIVTELLGHDGYANWSDIISADKSGMEILSHTENHLDLISSKYSQQDLNREIQGSKQKLESQLGHPVEYFIYPYGHTNLGVEALVQAAGYKLAFTTAYGMHQYQGKLLHEPRVRVHGVNGLQKLKTIFEPKPTPAPHTGPGTTNL